MHTDLSMWFRILQPLQSLDQEHKKKCEALIDDLVAWGAEERRTVYKAGFLDGLWLGHKAF